MVYSYILLLRATSPHTYTHTDTHTHTHTHLWYVFVNGIDDSQGANGDLREHPVDVFLDVAVLLRGEGGVVEQHLQPLLGVVHAEVVEGATVPHPC